MSAERYEIKECELDVLAIAGTDGTRYIDGEEIEARVIRQLRSDLAAVTAERDALREGLRIATRIRRGTRTPARYSARARIRYGSRPRWGTRIG